MTRRAKFLAVLVTVFTVASAGTAYAFWTAGNSGNATASADAVDAGNTPAGSATGGSVTLNWSASTTAAGGAVQGYVITRYDAATGGTATPAANGCSGTVSALTCTENGLGTGTWYYTVTPKLQSWLGAESARSAGIAVDVTQPTVVSINRAGASANVNSGPLTWTVTFSEPVNGVANSNFSLATSGIGGTAPSITSTTATGGAPSATWTVSVSTTGTTGTNAGSIGLKLANNTNIEDVANNDLSTTTFTGQAYTYDTTAPTLSTLQMFDDDHDGKVDKVVATFNDNLGSCTAPCTTGWTLASAPGGATLNSVAVAGNQATLTLNEGTVNTAVGSFTVALQNTSGIVDALGNHASFAATAPADKAEPVATALALANANGTAARDDTLAITYSEPLSLTSVCSGWTGTTLAGNNNVVVTVTNSSSNDVLSITSVGTAGCGGAANFHFGSVSLGSDYVSTTRTFSGTGGNASEISWSSGTSTLTVTLGSASGSVNTSVTAGTPTYSPDASITDAASPANAIATFSGTYSSGRF